MFTLSSARRLKFGIVLFIGLLPWTGLLAAIVSLDAFVTIAIRDDTVGMAPLVDGSYVVILGSGDSVADPMHTGPGTNTFIAFSTTGDDEILAIVQIGDGVSSAGTFFVSTSYDDSTINYTYIRFFDSTAAPILGTNDWGQSDTFLLTPIFGVASVDYNPAGDLKTTNTSNFAIIPEPGTANLMLLFLVVAGGIRARTKRLERERKLREGPT